MSHYLDLYDYRCRVATSYHKRNQALLASEDPALTLQRFRKERDNLFASHPQSALDEEQKREFQGLRYFPYNPALRFTVTVNTNVASESQHMTLSEQESLNMTTVGQVSLIVDGQPVTLSLYWLDIYGGGLFLPFRDATCPQESYGGGRYLFDTIKGSTPVPIPNETGWKRMILDFNYAYNPSCAYNPRWICPLAPAENTLTVAIAAGEMKFFNV
ncbi:hypothetical protein KSF_055370 [Reticulibacter mediterranei]|uniref:DUF1684 domain-containing protein n=1 Tax=Reticulibacter mediterranei TaxID=2778369 RepID=A0A8J3IH78_9CHLR|nr:DUF1684 domain-containing protein [Reticulibacter mediterranei]GHO95489.1 hypothetical protein KSF_055370 [Reticulibacter mediterranei]